MSAQVESNVRLVVKNTFLELVDDDTVDVPTRGCYSDSDLESLGGLSTSSTAFNDNASPSPPTSDTSGEPGGSRSAKSAVPARPLPLSQLSLLSRSRNPSAEGNLCPSTTRSASDGLSDPSDTTGSSRAGKSAVVARARPLPLSQLNLLGRSCGQSKDMNPGRCATPSAQSESDSWADMSESSDLLDNLQEQSAGAWSVGSELHASGDCKPCLYFISKMGCLNGPECEFCHQPHQLKRRARPSKSMRMQCKQLASMVDSAQRSPEVIQAAQAVAEESSYLKSILSARIKLPDSIAADSALPQGGRPVDHARTHAEVQAALRQFQHKVEMKKSAQRNIQQRLGRQQLTSASSSCGSSASSASGF